MKCDKCGSTKDVHEHHIIPKSIGNPNSLKNGKRIWLCEKHHNIIHKMLIKVIWEFVDKRFGTDERCKEAIRKFTEWFIKNG